MKRFKKRNKLKEKLFRFIILIIIFSISFVYTFKFLYAKINLKLDNQKYVKYLISDSLGTYNLSDITTLNSTQFLLKYSLGINIDSEVPVVAIDSPVSEIKQDNTNILPLVYIYNTHQKEEYKTNFSDTFNINNTVVIASYILKEYLQDLGINSIVEENSVADVLNKNNWRYGASYRVSRMFLNDVKKNNDSLKYFFDIHRDSSPYKNTVTEIDGKKFARVLFVVGLENENYSKNLENAKKIESKIKEYNPALSRGIMEKQGKGVNGVYNQDFSEQTFLIEIGGQYNTIEEINNTIRIVAKAIYEYIMEEEHGEKKG